MKENKTEANVIDSGFYSDNLDYYGSKLADMPGVSWNWSAFVFASTWLAYRKMYGWAAVVALIELAITAVGSVFPDLIYAVLGLAFTVQLILGLFGNAIFFSRVKKHSAKTAEMSKAERREYLIKHGGSSVKGTIIFVVIVAVVSLPIEFIVALFSEV